MLDVELLGVTGVVVEPVAVGDVTGLSLTLFSLQELGLVCVDFVVGPVLLGLAFVLQVALQFAGCQGVHHLGVILHTAKPHLLAPLLQVGLFVVELQIIKICGIKQYIRAFLSNNKQYQQYIRLQMLQNAFTD